MAVPALGVLVVWLGRIIMRPLRGILQWAVVQLTRFWPWLLGGIISFFKSAIETVLNFFAKNKLVAVALLVVVQSSVAGIIAGEVSEILGAEDGILEDAFPGAIWIDYPYVAWLWSLFCLSDMFSVLVWLLSFQISLMGGRAVFAVAKAAFLAGTK